MGASTRALLPENNAVPLMRFKSITSYRLLLVSIIFKTPAAEALIRTDCKIYDSIARNITVPLGGSGWGRDRYLLAEFQSAGTDVRQIGFKKVSGLRIKPLRPRVL